MKCKVIKIGGALIEDAGLLNRLCRKFASMTSPFVIVHGGGTFAGQLAERLGIPRKMIDGRRVTDRETLEVTVMVYAGWINKTLVARLQALGVNACGLSGCDLNLVKADRREGQSIDWGYVGDVRLVRMGGLELLLQAGVVPVISPITHDGKGVLLNSNADGIAAAVAEAIMLQLHLLQQKIRVLQRHQQLLRQEILLANRFQQKLRLPHQLRHRMTRVLKKLQKHLLR